MQNLVIVESPVKARTLQSFLGDKYQIEASMGHVRDLPKGDLGVDVEHNFEPRYIIPKAKLKTVNNLKKIAKGTKTLWLATDPDREGEAIAWHIAQLVSGSVDRSISKDIKRVVFHEITPEAIKEAFENPRGIDLKLVDAQQARRVLDRLVGYKLSPLLWQKVKRGLSAGRVQSVALRLVVEREREVTTFKPQEYWIIEAILGLVGSDFASFTAILIEQNGKKLTIKNKNEADGHVKNLQKADYQIAKVTKKEVRRYPFPPFTTSTLQQTASNRLGFSARRAMMLAQNLYERGLITYMRTDSVNLASQAIASAREFIGKEFGRQYLPKSPRLYKSKAKNIQEAHEAIRTTDVRTQGQALRSLPGMNRDHVRLYDLIWKRFVACQMNEAVMDQTTVDVKASTSKVGFDSFEVYLLRATGSVIKFDGWLKLYGKEAETASAEGSGESREDGEEKKQVLPKLSQNDPLNLIQIIPGQHFTEPPPRYTEASLIKKLEELGIGRPSTYAAILSIIVDRFYVERQLRRFIPTALGFAVTDFLVKNFADIVDYQFTAQMEDELDEISRGERSWVPTLREFYTPFAKKLAEIIETAEKVKLVVEYAGKKCPDCGKELIVRTGKFGKFLACSGFPECKYTESLEEKIAGLCPDDGGEVVVRRTRKGRTFYGCKNWPKCKYASWTKPKGRDNTKVST